MNTAIPLPCHQTFFKKISGPIIQWTKLIFKTWWERKGFDILDQRAKLPWGENVVWLKFLAHVTHSYAVQGVSGPQNWVPTSPPESFKKTSACVKDCQSPQLFCIRDGEGHWPSGFSSMSIKTGRREGSDILGNRPNTSENFHKSSYNLECSLNFPTFFSNSPFKFGVSWGTNNVDIVIPGRVWWSPGTCGKNGLKCPEMP